MKEKIKIFHKNTILNLITKIKIHALLLNILLKNTHVLVFKKIGLNIFKIKKTMLKKYIKII